MAYRQGTRMDQALFCQHSVQFVRSEGLAVTVAVDEEGQEGEGVGEGKGATGEGLAVPGAGHILLFNNGRSAGGGE